MANQSPRPSTPPPASGKTIYLWIFLLLLIGLLVWGPFGKTEPNAVSYSLFKTELREGNVESVTMTGRKLDGVFETPVEISAGNETVGVGRFQTHLPTVDDAELLPLIAEQGVELRTRPEPGLGWAVILMYLAPFLFLLLIGYFIFAQMRNRGQGMLSIGQSQAKLYDRTKARVTFDDVAGTEGAKDELRHTVEFLKNPVYFKRLGGKIPKGVLLVGPPGTGKTLLARAVAGEADVPFFSTSGSDFVEMFVGIGASRVRKMFEEAKRAAPSIIFIDELDSVGRRRGAGIGGGHDEREQTLNQLLSEMDGFEANESVIVMAATNRPDVLDPAILRPGRFDRQVTVHLPNRKSRLMILRIHARTKRLKDDVDLERVARATPGFSGADLENLLNEAALLATLEKKDAIENRDIDLARDRIMLGRKREGVYMSPEDMRLLAYHEAGHATISIILPNADPIEKITIVPRGQSMGVTQQLPEEERLIYRSDYILDHLAVMMGGRAAEELIFSTATSGAARDLHQATRLARKMVVEFGMSKALDQMHLGDSDHQVFLGEDIARQRDFSEATAELVDQEIRRILKEAYQRSIDLLRDHRKELDELAARLLEEEELSGAAAMKIFGLNPDEARQPIAASVRVRQKQPFRTH